MNGLATAGLAGDAIELVDLKDFEAVTLTV
jgi:hypothetical protein